MTTLLDTLAQRLDAQLRRDGRYHADCPFCHKEAKQAQKHFSFCESGYICWVCDAQGGLRALAEHLDIAGDAPAAPRRVERPQEPRHWQKRPDYYLDRYCGAFDRVQAWQAYKPLTLDSIARFRLGVGTLPASRCERRRLIVPVFSGGNVVAFHGRAYRDDDTDAKWLTAGGSSKQVLFNADSLHSSPTVVIVENFIDAILVMQAEPGLVAVAGGGVSWRAEWTMQIAQARPKHVLLLLDNDLAGFPNLETYAHLRAEWERAHPGVKPPEPRGPKIATALVAAGIRSVRGPNWPPGTPPKFDIGQDLARRAA